MHVYLYARVHVCACIYACRPILVTHLPVHFLCSQMLIFTHTNLILCLLLFPDRLRLKKLTLQAEQRHVLTVVWPTEPVQRLTSE